MKCKRTNLIWMMVAFVGVVDAVGQSGLKAESRLKSMTPFTGFQAAADNSKAPAGKDLHILWRKSLVRNCLGMWGVLQVVSILANAIKRLLPIAIVPFQQNDLRLYQWLMMAAWSAWMGYAEGYRAFQQKFSPLVVSRAFSLSDNPSIANWVLAGPYSMGMFGADRKRIIVSWAITAGVFSLVKLVKFLPYPYRSIVDAGVVVGLSYGAASIIAQTLVRLFQRSPDEPKKQQ